MERVSSLRHYQSYRLIVSSYLARFFFITVTDNLYRRCAAGEEKTARSRRHTVRTGFGSWTSGSTGFLGDARVAQLGTRRQGLGDPCHPGVIVPAGTGWMPAGSYWLRERKKNAQHSIVKQTKATTEHSSTMLF